ncbi:MAG: glutathione S-transferase family protein [Sphingomicrobium sp.]
MILFGSSVSPFVRKVLAFAAEAGIELEHRAIGLNSDDAEFNRASPFRKIPALLDGDFALADSSAIVHYLDALRPDSDLIPSEPRAKGRCVWWDEWADTLLFACGGKMFFNRIVAPRFLGRDGDSEVADNAERDELPPLLDYLEREIPPSGFLVEDRLTLADIAVASPFANFDYMEVDIARWPKVKTYVAALLARPSFAGQIAADKAFFVKLAARS